MASFPFWLSLSALQVPYDMLSPIALYHLVWPSLQYFMSLTYTYLFKWPLYLGYHMGLQVALRN